MISRGCTTVTGEMIAAQNRAMSPELPGKLAAWLTAEGIDTGWADGEQVNPDAGAAALAGKLISTCGADRVAEGISTSGDAYLRNVAIGLADLSRVTAEEYVAEDWHHGNLRDDLDRNYGFRR